MFLAGVRRRLSVRIQKTLYMKKNQNGSEGKNIFVE